MYYIFFQFYFIHSVLTFCLAELIKYGDDYKQEESFIVSALHLVPHEEGWVVKYHGMGDKIEVEKWTKAINDNKMGYKCAIYEEK